MTDEQVQAFRLGREEVQTVIDLAAVPAPALGTEVHVACDGDLFAVGGLDKEFKHGVLLRIQ